MLYGRPSFLSTLSHLTPTTAQSVICYFGPIFKRRLKLRELNCVVQRHKAKTHHRVCSDTDAGNLEAQTVSHFTASFILRHQVVNVGQDHYSPRFRTKMRSHTQWVISRRPLVTHICPSGECHPPSPPPASVWQGEKDAGAK